MEEPSVLQRLTNEKAVPGTAPVMNVMLDFVVYTPLWSLVETIALFPMSSMLSISVSTQTEN